MPDTPTTPDSLPIILGTDTPDVPRDMNALANATQAALNGRATNQEVTDAIAAAVAKVRVGHCAMDRSAPWAVPSKNAWHQIPFDQIVGGSVHPEWGNAGTGKITVPATGVYSMQFTGACQTGVGVVAFNVTTDGYSQGELFLQDSGHHVDTGHPFFISLSNLFTLSAGDTVLTKVNVQQHTGANPQVWGTMILGRVEAY